MFINFSDIAGHSNIFLDYLNEFENVEKYFKLNFRKKNDYSYVFESLLQKQRPHKNKIVSIISNQYSGLKLSNQTDFNINLLKKDNTIAIVTGQQLGLMGGPLYTFYKIITAIKLADFFNSKYEAYNFVPVFWLEGDDHDFEEVRSFTIINKDNDLQNVMYDDGHDEEYNRGSIGKLGINKNIRDVFKELNESLRGTEFTDDILDKLYSFYNEESTFKSAFKKLLHHLFDEYGLIIFDPQEKQVKELLKPVFKYEIENFRTHANISVERSAELEDVYHAQVKVKPLNLFYSDESGRHPLEPSENEFKLKGKKKRFTKEDLLDYIDTYPENFSPNVVLRPIAQDYLIPTGIYVGGPGEISYFAQVIPFYSEFDVIQPILYPRISATIVEKSATKIMSKFNLDYSDFYFGEQYVTDKVVKDLESVKVSKEIKQTSKTIEDSFNSLNDKLLEVDPTLKGVLEKSKGRIMQTLETLEDKTSKAQEKKYETSIRQVGKAIDLLYPYAKLQERELNFIYFVNKYGMDFLKLLYNQLALNKFEHQIIEL